MHPLKTQAAGRMALVFSLAALLTLGSRFRGSDWPAWAAPPEPSGRPAVRVAPIAAAASAPLADSSSDTEQLGEVRQLRGRVVWLDEVLQRRFSIPTDPDAAHSQLVLETTSGELVLVAKDSRGRAFWIDPRLRELDLELEVRQPVGSPAGQIIRTFVWHDQEKYELDYWCDICAIPMYELKPCECCQGETRIRQRLVGDPLREWEGL